MSILITFIYLKKELIITHDFNTKNYTTCIKRKRLQSLILIFIFCSLSSSLECKSPNTYENQEKTEHLHSTNV
ncbi:hypothetical protein HanIR_Chr09g0430921 [Helianthus annuus]|nr:hypothetical protein HanIR_Chr09g0430921 [Helianthus annuus]